MVEDEFLEIAPIYQFLELLSERNDSLRYNEPYHHGSTVLPGSWSFRVGRKRPRAPDELVALHGAICLIHGDFKRSEVDLWALAGFRAGWLTLMLYSESSWEDQIAPYVSQIHPLAWRSDWQNSGYHP